MNAVLLYYWKNKPRENLILELSIYQIVSERYPDGIKYGLIFVDTETGKRVLMDNHHPKGHHVHIDLDEFSYHFESVAKLVEDFQTYIFSHFGVNYEKIDR
jgi:hypothetical protein